MQIYLENSNLTTVTLHPIRVKVRELPVSRCYLDVHIQLLSLVGLLNHMLWTSVAFAINRGEKDKQIKKMGNGKKTKTEEKIHVCEHHIQ